MRPDQDHVRLPELVTNYTRIFNYLHLYVHQLVPGLGANRRQGGVYDHAEVPGFGQQRNDQRLRSRSHPSIQDHALVTVNLQAHKLAQQHVTALLLGSSGAWPCERRHSRLYQHDKNNKRTTADICQYAGILIEGLSAQIPPTSRRGLRPSSSAETSSRPQPSSNTRTCSFAKMR